MHSANDMSTGDVPGDIRYLGILDCHAFADFSSCLHTGADWYDLEFMYTVAVKNPFLQVFDFFFCS